MDYVKLVEINESNLVGQTFLLQTGIDFEPKHQTTHRATVIGLNPVPPDSLLVKVEPPFEEGKYADPKYFKGQMWRQQVKQFDKAVLLRRVAGTRVCPPCPGFPLTVHLYVWPDPPVERPTVEWGAPDDWANLHFDDSPFEVRNSHCLEALKANPDFYFSQPPLDHKRLQAESNRRLFWIIAAFLLLAVFQTCAALVAK